MAEKADTTEVYWQHNWLFVIIPVQYSYTRGAGTVPDTFPLFSAYCKACDTYYTKKLGYYSDYTGDTGHAGLPKYGCVGPEGI